MHTLVFESRIISKVLQLHHAIFTRWTKIRYRIQDRGLLLPLNLAFGTPFSRPFSISMEKSRARTHTIEMRKRQETTALPGIVIARGLERNSEKLGAKSFLKGRATRLTSISMNSL